MRLSPQPEQLLDILDRSQNGVSHVLQRRCFVEGTHALRRASLLFRAFLVLLPVCKKYKQRRKHESFPELNTETTCWVMFLPTAPTVLVLLQLHAAVVDALDAAEAPHLLVDAQILQNIGRRDDHNQNQFRKKFYLSGYALHRWNPEVQTFIHPFLNRRTYQSCYRM